MKKIHVCITLMVLLCMARYSSAQSARPFWNIEVSPREHPYTLVRYYSADRRLLGEERLTKRVDITRRRSVRKLDKKLSTYVMADSLSRIARNKIK